MKKVTLIFLVILSFFVHSKEVELSVQTGHSDAVRTVLFSNDGTLIASAGDDNKIVLWDFYSGRQFAELNGHTRKINSLHFSHDDEWLISCSEDSTCVIWNLKTLTLKEELKFNFSVKKAHLTKDKSKLFIGGPRLILYQLKDKSKKELPFNAYHFFNEIELSEDESIISFGGQHEPLIYVCDIVNNKVLKRIPGSATDLKFVNKDSSLLFATSNGIMGIAHYGGKKKKSLTTDWMLNSINAINHYKEFIIGATNSGDILVVDSTKFQIHKILREGKHKIFGMDIHQNTSTLVVGLENGELVTWDLSSFLPIKHLRGSVNQIDACKFSENGEELLICYNDGVLRKSNLITNQSILNSPTRELKSSRSIYDWSAYEIESFNSDSAKLILLKKRKSFGEAFGYEKIESYNSIWNFKENKLTINECELPESVNDYLIERKKGLAGNLDLLVSKNNFQTQSTDSIYTISIDKKSVKLENRFKVSSFLLKTESSFKPSCVAINNEFGFFAIAGKNGLIEFRNVKDGEKMVTYGPFENGQFIYLTKEGYYFSSKKALEFLSYRVDGKIYGFDQFDLLYNRPDIVVAKLPFFNELFIEAYNKAYLKRLDKLGVTEENLKLSDKAPTVTIKKNSSDLLITGELILNIKCTDLEEDLSKLHIKVNGVPEYGRLGKNISGKTYSDSVRLILNTGENLIQVYCTNKSGISSLQESFYVQGMKQQTKPNLYLISLGVSRYQESQYNLNFAAKDAKDFVRYFSRANLAFNEVNSLLLVDSMVTKSNLNQLSEFIQKPNPNDVVLCFIAGHGVLDKNYDYFIASHDMRFTDPAENGIAYDYFEELMDQTKSRKKVLFIDACHSGEIDKKEVIETEVIESEMGDIKFRSATGIQLKYGDELSSFDLAKTLFADMRLSNGTTVISGAGGTEFAIESDTWSNGAFTYCLLYGLSSRNADLNKDRIITLSELQEYLFFQVNKLTDGKQTPTSRVENLNNDFRIN